MFLNSRIKDRVSRSCLENISPIHSVLLPFSNKAGREREDAALSDNKLSLHRALGFKNSN